MPPCANQLRLDALAREVPCIIRTAPVRYAFVVASGPSLKQQDLSVLPSAHTIAVNRSFEVVDAHYTYLMDDRLVEWILTDEFHSKVRFLSGSAIHIKPSPLGPRTPAQLAWPVEYVPRCIDPSVANYDSPRMYAGNNSGFGAIQLACWMGATRIYLLGFDMHARNGTHFHGGYRCTVGEAYDQKLEMFRKELEDFAPKFVAAGVEVINLSPDSALTCFPKRNLKEVL